MTDLKGSRQDWSSVLPSELLPQLEEILSASRIDFTTGPWRNFCEDDIMRILERAKGELWAKLKKSPIHTSSDLAQAWNEIVTDFYAQKYWGFVAGRVAGASVAKKMSDNKQSNELIPYLRSPEA
jgi:hypothetical protein